MIRDLNTPSGTALIFVDDDGENMIVVAPGANQKLSIADVDAARETIASAKVMILQLEVPLETVVHAAELAKASGLQRSFSIPLRFACCRPNCLKTWTSSSPTKSKSPS